jgi:hypothetical protein
MIRLCGKFNFENIYLKKKNILLNHKILVTALPDWKKRANFFSRIQQRSNISNQIILTFR